MKFLLLKGAAGQGTCLISISVGNDFFFSLYLRILLLNWLYTSFFSSFYFIIQFSLFELFFVFQQIFLTLVPGFQIVDYTHTKDLCWISYWDWIFIEHTDVSRVHLLSNRLLCWLTYCWWSLDIVRLVLSCSKSDWIICKVKMEVLWNSLLRDFERLWNLKVRKL